ncbi:MAG: undecaprenyldiphospho-muramoylpentapeptide beta-N-acetylglucosaminyltransferase [Lachnospiraceae bacterium]|nr:undecaprenyldiphospho-muramoylpentapeptide beta-N-acetylglucosaminyltransferase [Lachnospiraceae bacterium]
MGKTIVLTGGGTAGHVTPNLALLPGLRERGFDIHYIGSFNGIEKELLTKAGVPYSGISTGKLRRYLSKENLKDVGNVLRGIREAKKLMKEIRPDIVFSKGGYVAVPVVRAAAKYHIPVIIHESDMTPGLANKLCYSAASKICCNFPETVELLPKEKAVLSGSPIREELLSGSREAGLRFTGLSGEKPVLLMIGGSSGARILNERLRSSLDTLLETFDIVHLCGKGNLDESLKKPGYLQYEYISEELKDLFALADVIFSRAGANALCEFLALKKPALLVPLSKAASRGDQILNAKSFAAQGFSEMIEEEDLTDEKLISGLLALYENRERYIAKMSESSQSNGVGVILGLIDELTEGK